MVHGLAEFGTRNSFLHHSLLTYRELTDLRSKLAKVSLILCDDP
ncbi:hypothetical protein RIEGSTA812A_PEG_726 [invertebrate metagenome]|uniref:Uncharacterized protein n=1 Tax=invertebrate metagenome TaxID=1711999 RepID=A0A484H8X0_9ZZZZ